MSDPLPAGTVEEPSPSPEPELEPAALPTAAEDDAALDALESSAVEIPTGEKLVPLSAVTTLRERLKEAKKGSADAATLRQQLSEAQAHAAQLAPFAHAFQALQQAQQAQPGQTAAAAEDTAELEDIAKDFDFYKPDGTADLARAKKHQERETKRAEAIAQRTVAPMLQQSLSSAAQENLRLAKATVNPDTGKPLDAAVIDAVFGRIAAQGPAGLQTLADREQVKMLWVMAKGLSPAQKAAVAQRQEPTIDQPAPVFTERSGGRNITQPKALSESEKRAAKDAGLTHEQYLAIAKGMPW